MASINEDNLREEETRGGFEPGQAEDDSFMLEGQEKYPGELPDFDSGDQPVVIEDSHEAPTPSASDSTETSAEPAAADDDVPEDVDMTDVDMTDVDMAEQIEPPAAGGSVWDSFDEEESSATEEPDVEVDTEGLIPKQEEYVVEHKKDIPPKQAEEEIPEPAEQPVINEVKEEKITIEESAEEIPAAPEPPDVGAEEAATEIPEGIEDLILPTETTEVETETEIETETEEIGQAAKESGEDIINENIVSDDIEAEEEAAEIDETPAQETEGILDDDFKKALAGDIEKSKARKEESKAEEKAENETDDTETPEMKPEDFTPVDDHEDAQLIDINEIEADKPSNYGLQAGIESSPLPKTDEMKIADNATGPEAMPVEGGVKLKKKKKRKNRKPLPLKRIAIIALIIIFGAAVAFVGYNYVYKSGEGSIAHLDSLAGSDSAAHIEKPAAADVDKEINKEINKEAGEEVHEPAATDTLGIHGENAENIAEEAAATEKPKAKQVDKQKPARKKFVAQAPVKKSKAPKQKKAKQRSIEDKDIAERPVIVKPKLPIEIKPEKPAQRKRISTKLPELTLPKSDKGLFTIQIYASPSREDAEEWLNKLRNKKIRDSFISKHQIRDQIWYRVRFGKFETKEEARTTALRYGFAQTWIDRVR